MALSRLRTAIPALALALVTGCAAGPPTVGPAGVDGLEIPTPSPDQADFVDAIDNPWLPLTPGAQWVFDGDDGGRTVTVAEETREVAGVAATVVREVVTAPGGRVVDESEAWFAQDTEGNVWLLGEDGVWEAGVDGAQAGLAMAADPRVGDGYRLEYAEGVAEDQAEVVALDGTATVPAGTYDDLVVVEQRSALRPGLVERISYARGIGPVLVEAVSGADKREELVRFSAGA